MNKISLNLKQVKLSLTNDEACQDAPNVLISQSQGQSQLISQTYGTFKRDIKIKIVSDNQCIFIVNSPLPVTFFLEANQIIETTINMMSQPNVNFVISTVTGLPVDYDINVIAEYQTICTKLNYVLLCDSNGQPILNNPINQVTSEHFKRDADGNLAVSIESGGIDIDIPLKDITVLGDHGKPLKTCSDGLLLTRNSTGYQQGIIFQGYLKNKVKTPSINCLEYKTLTLYGQSDKNANIQLYVSPDNLNFYKHCSFDIHGDSDFTYNLSLYAIGYVALATNTDCSLSVYYSTK